MRKGRNEQIGCFFGLGDNVYNALIILVCNTSNFAFEGAYVYNEIVSSTGGRGAVYGCDDTKIFGLTPFPTRLKFFKSQH